MIVVIVYGALNNKPTISVDMLVPRSYWRSPTCSV